MLMDLIGLPEAAKTVNTWATEYLGWIEGYGAFILIGFSVAVLIVINKPNRTKTVRAHDHSSGTINRNNDHRSLLQEAVEKFLASSGRSAKPSADRTPHTYVMANNSDGRGAFIEHWGRDMGPWPTIEDGFSSHQLRRSPIHGLRVEWADGPTFNKKPILGGEAIISALFSGVNLNAAQRATEIKDAYLESAVTGRRLQMRVKLGGDRVLPKEVNPVPYKARVLLESENFGSPNGIGPERFLADWSPMFLVVEYADGACDRIEVEEDRIAKLMQTKRVRATSAGPRVTRKVTS
ncbi:hypothetical protein [Candidatus Phaeomarinobacter ectocarpi]|nr:hypothetical protein [Candidatus Phaeomarinobacter ectocarpi]